MQLIINGQAYLVEEGATLEVLLKERGWLGKRLAVELNREIVPKSSYVSTVLKSGDVLEVVVAVGGG